MTPQLLLIETVPPFEEIGTNSPQDYPYQISNRLNEHYVIFVNVEKLKRRKFLEDRLNLHWFLIYVKKPVSRQPTPT